MSLELLLSQSIKGDQKAFSTLYRQLSPDLITYGRRLCQDKQLAEDCIQELFVELWNKKEQFAQIQNTKSYFLTSLRRKIFRKIKSNPKWSNVEDSFSVTFGVSEEAFGDFEDNGEMMAQVKELIDQLSQRQKEVLYLKYFQGMDYEEIQEITGLEYQSLRNHMSKALKKIRQLMPLFLFFLILKRVQADYACLIDM